MVGSISSKEGPYANHLTKTLPNGKQDTIDIQETHDGTGYSYRRTHYGTLQPHEIFDTPDEAADAGIALQQQLYSMQIGIDKRMTHELYLEFCERLGVEPKAEFEGWEHNGDYSIYQHGAAAIAARLHQLRYAEVRREHEQATAAQREEAQRRAFAAYVEAEEEDAEHDRYQ
jgi:hypothetical protein